MEQKTGRRLPRLLFAAAVLPLALIVMAGLGEVGARLFIRHQTIQIEPFRIALDNVLHRRSAILDLYWEMVPHANATLHDVPVATNSLGFRDRDYGPKDGARRIVMLGDSITFGAMVPAEESHPRVLESLLKQWSPEPVEVINCGVCGYNFIQDAVNYEAKADQYAPDLITVGFFMDDIDPPYVPQQRGLVLQLELRSQLYRLLKLRLRTHWPSLVGSQSFVPAAAETAFKSRLLDFIRRREVEGIHLLFIIHPMLDQQWLRNDPIAGTIQPLLNQWKVPYLEMDKIYLATGRPITDFQTPEKDNVHPNALGHRLIAETINAYLREHPELLTAGSTR